MEDIREIAYSEQPLDDDERKLKEKVYSRLQLFLRDCREFQEHAKEMRDIVRMRDPEQDSPANNSEQKEKTLQLQTLRSTFKNDVADQMLNLPEAKLIPETPEQAEAVEDMQDLVHHVIYETNTYTDTHRKRAGDFYATGTAITEVVWDPDMSWGKGDIAILRWPIEAFLWDRQADDIQNSRAVIKVSWHPMEWFEDHYPEIYPYMSAENGLWEDVGITDEQREKLTEDEQRAMLVEYWWRSYNAKSRKYQINVAYCAGGALIDVQKDVYTHGMYPFVLDVYDPIEGSMVGEGLTDELAPMMRYINRYARYIDTNLRMSSKGRILARRESGIDVEALRNWDNDIIEGDSVEQGRDWAWMQHNPFNGMIAQQLLQFQSDMKQDSGQNQFSRGETTGGIVSGKAITALQTAGGKIQQMYTSVLACGFKCIVEQVLWLISQFYERDRITMVLGANRGTRAIHFDNERFFGKKGKEISPPPYVVQVEIVSKDPSRIEARNNMYMQAYTMAAQAQQFFPLSSLFEILNVEGKDQLMPVIRANEQYQQQMQQMQQQLEQMQGQMEQLQGENNNLKQISSQMTNALAGVRGFTGGRPQAPAGIPQPGTAQAAAAIGRGALMDGAPNLEQMPEGAA